jgi:hypothetical protein
MKGVCRVGGVFLGVVAAALAIGCGGSDTSSVLVPTAGAVATCFRDEGATSVYQRKEGGVTLVDGLVGTNGIVSVELTGGRTKSEDVIERLEAEDVPSLRSFEALEGAVVGVFSKGKPAGKQIVLNCLE